MILPLGLLLTEVCLIVAFSRSGSFAVQYIIIVLGKGYCAVKLILAHKLFMICCFLISNQLYTVTSSDFNDVCVLI